MQWGELLTFEYGKPVKDKANTDGPVPVFGTNGQIGTSFLEPLCKFPSFVVGRKGAYRGVHYSDVPFSVIDTAFYANPITDTFDIKWAYYKFLTYNINLMDSGSAIPSTDRYELYRIPIELPPIDTQRKVVAILDSLNAKIKNNEAINRNLEEQAKLLYKSWFIDFENNDNEMPADWRFGTVEEIVELHDSIRKPLSGNERDKLEKIYPYYGATSIMDYVDNYLFDGIYLLLGEDGSVMDSNGYPILQYVFGKFWVNNHAHVITGKNGFSVEELYLLFGMTNVHNIVTGAVQLKINQRNLLSLEVVVPSNQALKDFDEIVQPIFNQIRNMKLENDRLTALRDSLLPKLMSGELDVSDLEI